MSSQYDASIDATIADIQAFWATTMPDVYGQQYEAIPTDRVFPYSESQPAAELRRRRPDHGAVRGGRRQRLLLQQR